MIRKGEYIAFCGELGSGKTLNMTRIGAMEAIAGRDVYANYPTAFATEIMSLSHLFSIRDGLLLLDELQATLDSREFKKSADVTQWCVLVRKLGLSVCYTTQDISFVDVRVRKITGYMYNCEPCTWGGRQATKIELYRLRSEQGRMIRKFIMPHTDVLYGLYNSFDTKVKLTNDSRVTSFDPAAFDGVTVRTDALAQAAKPQKSIFSR